MSINRTEYSMGIFEFKMQQVESTVEATFDASKYDGCNLETVSKSMSKVTLIGAKQGKTETLEFIAPRILVSKNNGITALHITATESK